MKNENVKSESETKNINKESKDKKDKFADDDKVMIQRGTAYSSYNFC